MGNTSRKELVINRDLSIKLPSGVWKKFILICGDTHAGKSWITKNLLRLLKCDYDDIEDGDDKKTIGTHLHYKDQPNNNENICVIDTEGLNRPYQQGDDDGDFNLNTMILSLIYGITGVILFVTSEYKESDELMIKMICTMIRPDKRVIVLHNRKTANIKVKQKILDDLYKNEQLPIKNTGDAALSYWNGIIIEHYVIINKKYTDINDQIFNRILNVANLMVKNEVSDSVEIILTLYDKLTDRNFNFVFLIQQLGEIQICFRLVNDVEYRTLRLNDNSRILCISGANLDYTKTSIKSIDKKNWQNIYNCFVVNRDGIRATFQFWLPEILIKIGEPIVDNNRVIFACQIFKDIQSKQLQ
jgi:hypothetical protein